MKYIFLLIGSLSLVLILRLKLSPLKFHTVSHYIKASLAIQPTGSFACMPATRHASAPVSRQAGRRAGFKHSCGYNHFLAPLSPFFFLAALISGNNALRAGITAQNPIRLLTDCYFYEKAAKCPSSYPKAFRLLPKIGSSKVCFEFLRKPCRQVASPKSGNLYQ